MSQVNIDNSSPATYVKKPTATSVDTGIDNLRFMHEISKDIYNKAEEVADVIFDHLLDTSDDNILKGSVPKHENDTINDYVTILNRLFKFSRTGSNLGGVRVLNRDMVESLDEKTFVLAMCRDGGGVMLDVLCDIANTENQARSPKKSPTKFTVTQAFRDDKQNSKENHGNSQI